MTEVPEVTAATEVSEVTAAVEATEATATAAEVTVAETLVPQLLLLLFVSVEAD